MHYDLKTLLPFEADEFPETSDLLGVSQTYCEKFKAIFEREMNEQPGCQEKDDVLVRLRDTIQKEAPPTTFAEFCFVATELKLTDCYTEAFTQGVAAGAENLLRELQAGRVSGKGPDGQQVTFTLLVEKPSLSRRSHGFAKTTALA